jgi:hypothetical protein
LNLVLSGRETVSEKEATGIILDSKFEVIIMNYSKNN